MARLSAFGELETTEATRIWDRILARSVNGDRLTLAVVELEPGAIAAAHSHENEQLGIVLRGTMDFRVGDERRLLGPGGTWRIPPNVEHEATAGAEGAVVIDVFAPGRDDWRSLETTNAPPVWP